MEPGPLNVGKMRPEGPLIHYPVQDPGISFEP